MTGKIKYLLDVYKAHLASSIGSLNFGRWWWCRSVWLIYLFVPNISIRIYGGKRGILLVHGVGSGQVPWSSGRRLLPDRSGYETEDDFYNGNSAAWIGRSGILILIPQFNPRPRLVSQEGLQFFFFYMVECYGKINSWINKITECFVFAMSLSWSLQ